MKGMATCDESFFVLLKINENFSVTDFYTDTTEEASINRLKELIEEKNKNGNGETDVRDGDSSDSDKN